jgi:predicted nucleic acid-binding Zn ribbon protein
MPTYVYKFVETGETIEIQQAFTDDTLTKIKHPDTGKKMAVKKVFQPVGVTFKGSGFFKTDSRGSAGSSTGPASDSSSGSSDSTSSSESSTSSSASESSTSSETKKPETKKPDAKKSASKSSKSTS